MGANISHEMDAMKGKTHLDIKEYYKNLDRTRHKISYKQMQA